MNYDFDSRSFQRLPQWFGRPFEPRDWAFEEVPGRASAFAFLNQFCVFVNLALDSRRKKLKADFRFVGDSPSILVSEASPLGSRKKLLRFPTEFLESVLADFTGGTDLLKRSP